MSEAKGYVRGADGLLRRIGTEPLGTGEEQELFEEALGVARGWLALADGATEEGRAISLARLIMGVRRQAKREVVGTGKKRRKS